MPGDPSGTDSVSTIEVFGVVALKEASSSLEIFMPYMMRYFMTAPEAGGCQEMVCWMLPFSLTDTGPLFRCLTAPGVCAAESGLNILWTIGR